MNDLFQKFKSNLGRFSGNSDLGFVFGLFGAVLLLVVPVHKDILSILLVVSIAISLLILLTVIYVKDPPEFSVFPTLLLSVTLYRLGLNVASTRLILLDGDAGSVIESFGTFVVGGNYVVGTVIFLILVIINFVVITKGAGRIAEVTARFTLDAMPGKQMSIDAEMNSGVITEAEALSKREKIQKDADFYGSMDGASKFVRGDAVAGIFITVVNIIGGILIGYFQKEMTIVGSLEKYTILSIGDGLVSQVPAIIISIAAGILVTRSSEEANLGEFVGKQLTVYPRAIGIAGCMLLLFAFFLSETFWPFFILSMVCFGAAYHYSKVASSEESEFDEIGQTAGSSQPTPGGAPQQTSALNPEDGQENKLSPMENAIEQEVFGLEMGYGLLVLADKKKGGDLLDRITGARTNFAREMGMLLPTIGVRDNIELEPNEYRFLLRGKEIIRSTIMPDRVLAMSMGGGDAGKLNGIPTIEPVFGIQAMWIPDEERRNAEIEGCTVVDPSSVLVTHLADVLKRIAYLILEREGTQRLLDLIKDKNPTLVSELLPDLVNVGIIQRTLQNLLRERIPIKNLTIVLETIADMAAITKNPDDLSEQARKRLGMYFVKEYEVETDKLLAMTFEPRLEQTLISRVKRSQFDIGLVMDPNLTEGIIREIEPKIKEMTERGLSPIIVTTTELRLAFRRFMEPSYPQLVVLAYQELPTETQIEPFGAIALEAQSLPPDIISAMEESNTPRDPQDIPVAA
ncbi:MAG: flagellar biosynthesis protein FlhA [Opitutales bacterium]|nr:flagellar biosynthesis protein FlhA [Opitutales bacterium]MDG1324902.1 flagellar biosynthesis protein FlhA [Opitutales bacterium]